MKKKIIGLFVCMLLITSTLTFFGTNSVSSENPPKSPGEGWFVDGSGTYFGINNSKYLNITLTSDVNISLFMESIPDIINYYIESNVSTSTANITLSGLEPNSTYYMYQDNELLSKLTSNDTGSFSYNQDIVNAHHITILESPGTIYINSDGTITPSSAPISRNGETYTMTGNINEQITIRRSGITFNGDGYNLQSYGSYGLYLYFISDVTIKNLNIYDVSYAIYLEWSDNNVFKNITIDNAYYGFYIYWSDLNTIEDNTLSDSYYYAIWLFSFSDFNIILNNSITNSNYHGIFFYSDCTNNIINGNHISNYYWGICFGYDCNNNLINENVLQNNYYGIYLYEHCNNNQIIGNTIVNDFYYSLYFIRANYNKIHHNNIYTGHRQWYCTNTWDDSAGEGNYWDDYTGSDTNGDGVGDTYLPHRGIDYYPLMSPWTPNDPPVANAGGPYDEDEGTAITFNASGSSDPDGDELQYRWDFDNDGTWDTGYSTNPTATYTWYDDYTGTVAVEVYDGEFTDTATSTATVNNVAPTITALNCPLDPVQLGNSINVNGEFTDPGTLDTHNATINWGDSNVDNIGTITSPIPSQTHTYTETGVYTITLTVTDDDGGIDTEIFQYVVIYNSSGGFVTGGGWINSPKGAYPADPDLTGKAHFGFVSKYKKGKPTPIGNTEFQFLVADLNFHSDVYDWLVIAGPKAMYKGNGTVNGSGNYGFMISAIDEELTPSTDVDLFRIKIWDKDNNDDVIYDNMIGEEENEDPTTAIGGGNIKIHKRK